MRVCLVYGDYPPKPTGKSDGGADFVARLAERLVARGMLASVIVSRRDDRSAPYVTEGGVRVIPLVEDWSLNGALRGQFIALRRTLKEERADVVHLIYPDPYLRYGDDSYHLPFLLKPAGARRLLVTFFGFGVTGASIVTKVGLFTLFASANGIVITDHALLERFQRTFSFWAAKARSGSVGSIAEMDTSRWTLEAVEDRRRELGLPIKERLIGFFGFWTPDKGIEDLLVAINHLREQKLSVKLVLIGGREADFRTDYERKIVQLISDLGLNESVIHTGAIASGDVIRYLLATEVCVLPFRTNQLGRSSLAMALTLGVPTVVTRPPTSDSALEGLVLVEPNNPGRLSHAIRIVLASRDVQIRASEAAARLASRFSWDSIADDYVGQYLRLSEAG